VTPPCQRTPSGHRAGGIPPSRQCSKLKPAKEHWTSHRTFVSCHHCLHFGSRRNRSIRTNTTDSVVSGTCLNGIFFVLAHVCVLHMCQPVAVLVCVLKHTMHLLTSRHSISANLIQPAVNKTYMHMQSLPLLHACMPAVHFNPLSHWSVRVC
jgi:hypothetical protein